tara:strand:+ start:5557 stop:6393 length:837 start_codon:yes stop_codon:yes gene_type:complete
LRDVTYKYETVVVGNTIEALMCGYNMGCPVLTLGARPPLFFETFDSKSKLSIIGLNNDTRVLSTPSGNIEVGMKKEDLYRKLSLIMSLAGLLPLSDKAVSMRQVDKNTIKVVLDHARTVKFNFNKLLIFQKELLQPKTPPKYMVLDWMNVRSGMIHPFDRIQNNSLFVNCIHFYPSNRIDGAHDKKDLVSVSFLTREQIDSYQYSDTYARFKVIEDMKKAGIRGARNGRDAKNRDRYKHYAIRVEVEKRRLYPVFEHTSYMPMDTTEDEYLQYLSSVV